VLAIVGGTIVAGGGFVVVICRGADNMNPDVPTAFTVIVYDVPAVRPLKVGVALDVGKGDILGTIVYV
jgi:hypothetical protein